MRRLICSKNSSCEVGQVVKISEQESHHLSSVLRKKSGQKVEILISKDSTAYLAEIVSANELKLIKELKKTKKRNLELAVAIIKQTKCELIIEKATELGVSSVCFFHAEHGRESSKNIESKLDRLLRIRDTSLKQSKSTIITDIRIYSSLLECLDKSLETQGKSKETLARNKKILSLNPNGGENIIKLKNSNEFDDLYIIVGPEGGLSENEIDLASKTGAISTSLGETILKTETAAIIAAGIFLVD